MLASDKIKEFIQNQEGCKLIAYKPLPTDRWTIGYGSTFYSDGSPVKENDTITQEDAMKLINLSVDKLCKQLSKQKIPLNVLGNQFDAVVSLVYNIGFSAFTESSTGKLFYAGMNISEKFPMWNRSGGKVVQGLVNRRAKERDIYDHNRYPD